MPRNTYARENLGHLKELPFYNIPNIDLEILLHGRSNFENLLFDPTTLNDDPDQDNPLDTEMRKLIDGCKYIFPDSLSKTFLEESKNNNFSILTLNMRSIPKKFEHFCKTLSVIDNHFDIITVTETWLKKELENNFSMNDYNHIFLSRNNQDGGGVGIYISKQIEFKERPDLKVECEDCENLTVEIVNGDNKKNILVTVIYRPPDKNMDNFNIKFDQFLDIMNTENKSICVSEDF